MHTWLSHIFWKSTIILEPLRNIFPNDFFHMFVQFSHLPESYTLKPSSLGHDGSHRSFNLDISGPPSGDVGAGSESQEPPEHQRCGSKCVKTWQKRMSLEFHKMWELKKSNITSVSDSAHWFSHVWHGELGCIRNMNRMNEFLLCGAMGSPWRELSSNSVAQGPRLLCSRDFTGGSTMVNRPIMSNL